MPSALFVFTFERITFRIYPVWDEFIDIEESSARTSMFESWKTVEFRVNRKLRRLVFKRALHWYTNGLKITRERPYQRIRVQGRECDLNEKKRGAKSVIFKPEIYMSMGKSAIMKKGMGKSANSSSLMGIFAIFPFFLCGSWKDVRLFALTGQEMLAKCPVIGHFAYVTHIKSVLSCVDTPVQRRTTTPLSFSGTPTRN